jgi:hypothetical protein
MNDLIEINKKFFENFNKRWLKSKEILILLSNIERLVSNKLLRIITKIEDIESILLFNN